MKMVSHLFLCIFFNLLFLAENGLAIPFSGVPSVRDRFQLLTQEIRCVVCQNQSIADSNAPLAKDLREKIYRMILEKKSDDEIKNYLVKRYGEFILFKPRLNASTLILWLFPLLGSFMAILLVGRYHKKSKKYLPL